MLYCALLYCASQMLHFLQVEGKTLHLHIDKRISSPRKFKNYKSACTKHQSSKIYVANTNKIEERSRWYYQSWRLQYPTFNNRTRQKTNKETEKMSNIINQTELPGIYRKLHPTNECTFSSEAYGKLHRTDHMLSYEMSQNLK